MKRLCLCLALMLASRPARAVFAVDFPVVVRTQGVSTFFYTALDATNNSASPTDVVFEYISADLTIDAVGTLAVGLPGHANFHSDDFLQLLATQGAITQAQANGTFGTLLVTFTNPAFTTGQEASATVRVYNFVTPGSRPSIGTAYCGIVLRQNGSHALSSVLGNTTSAPASVPAVVTNMGFENVGINDAGQLDQSPVTVTLTFYDGATGARVGPQPTVTLQSGQMTQINDVWTTYGLPAASTTVVLSVQETSGTAQIRGYVVLKDVFTNDGSFYLMQ
ncbi:MAG: hypothetical protein ACHQM4_00910 [Thermoanaerobaculia bacterium]